MPSLVEISQVVLEKIFKFHQYFFILSYYLPLKKGVVLHLKKLESPSPKDGLYQVWFNMSRGSGGEEENVKSLRCRRRS